MTCDDSMVPRVKIAFTLTGQGVEPEWITESLGVQPTSTWRLGEQVARTSIQRKHDGWRLSTEEVETVDLPGQVRRLLVQLEPHIDAIRRLCDTKELEAELNCIVYVNDAFPVLHFDSDVVELIQRLKAEIDLDIMFLDDD